MALERVIYRMMIPWISFVGGEVPNIGCVEA
jgi:hypothetical protein